MSILKSDWLYSAVFAALCGLLTACTSSNQSAERFNYDLKIASKGLHSGKILRMDSVNVNQWDNMYIFPPYTKTKDIEKSINSRLPPSITESRIIERDDVNLIVFTNGEDVQMAATVPRSSIDFKAPILQPLSRKNAQFTKSATGERLIFFDQK